MSAEQDPLREIFIEAQGRTSPEDRERYLSSACAHDPSLRRQVDSLIEASHQAGDFLRQSVIPPAVPPVGEGPGSVIGRYKLLQQIGEGGFGVVFMAEQHEPVRRLVALKILKAGMDTREVVARFEAERQALAMMDHPNIARVLDGGVTAGGRPYFVMDLVKGIPITDFCERHQLPVEARLRLFLKVCAGVQHAHQKGVIHRDLKPTNVLVTLHDGEPVPKVIDFGIAKAIGQRLTSKTLFTRYEQLLGTPAYMSPEQAEWSGLDVDTRSDLYSLGVLLYELLTKTTPIEKETLARAALDEMRRMIREVEPPNPSTRLSARSGIRSAPHVPHSELHKIRGDLDWIVMKALEKDRGRRYETVNGLARDIGRHLNGEPVAARPPSRTYLAGKFVRKHRVAVSAGAAVAVALVAGLVFSLAGFGQAKRYLRLAQDESAASKAINDFFMNDLIPEVAAAGTNLDLTMRDILEKASAGMKHTVTGFPGGNSYQSVLEYESPDPRVQGVMEQLKQRLGPDHPVILKHQFGLISAYGVAGSWNRCVEVAHEVEKQTNFLALRREVVFRGAAASLLVQDTNSFRDFAGYLSRQALLKPHGEWAREAIEVCLLAPDLAPNVEAMLRLAETELTYITPAHAQFDKVARGLFEYRRGNLGEAWKWLQGPQASLSFDIGSQARYLCAMILFRQGDMTAAKAELAEARKWLASYERSGGLVESWDRWHQYARAVVTGGEAERLILGRQATPFIDAPTLAAARARWTPIRKHLNAGYDLASQAKWEGAAQEFVAAMHSPAFEWEPLDGTMWELKHHIGVTLLLAGDGRGHEQLCRDWFNRLGSDPHPDFLRLAVITALSGPCDPKSDLTRLALDWAGRLDRRSNPAELVWVIAAYRAGQFEEAARPLTAEGGRSEGALQSTAEVFQAMALAKLGRWNEGRGKLSEADATVEKTLNASNWGDTWWNIRLCQLALTEAHRLFAVRR